MRPQIHILFLFDIMSYEEGTRRAGELAGEQAAGMPRRRKGTRARPQKNGGEDEAGPSEPNPLADQIPPVTPRTGRTKKIMWCFLEETHPHAESIAAELEAAQDSGDEGGHTAEDALPYAQAVADVQHGASLAQHVPDLVCINDIFTSDVQQHMEESETKVVQELELGVIPERILPAPVSQLFTGGTGRGGSSGGGEDIDVDMIGGFAFASGSSAALTNCEV